MIRSRERMRQKSPRREGMARKTHLQNLRMRQGRVKSPYPSPGALVP
jgi:hypothetical protein